MLGSLNPFLLYCCALSLPKTLVLTKTNRRQDPPVTSEANRGPPDPVAAQVQVKGLNLHEALHLNPGEQGYNNYRGQNI